MADDFDLDLSDDFDFDSELASISGGTSYSEPPKNAREAAIRTLKDTKSGFIGAVKGDNVRELAKNVIEDSIPDKISNEYDTVKSAYEEVTGTVREELDGVKKESKKAVDAINKLIPGDTKINKLLKSISERLGDGATKSRELSKEEQQQNMINEAIVASLGEQKTIAQQNEALAQTMEEKRHISTTELLKNIYAELKMGRNFQFEVANNYYRKSLEIQFKQLYTAQEQLGIIKSGFETFKNQFEAIVKNTGLPEVVKIKQSEQVIKTIGDRYREELANTFYKDFDPFKNMKDRWVKNIKDFSNNLKEGLSGGADVVNMMVDMNDPEMGMSKGYTIGNFIGNTVRRKLVQKVSNKLYGTEKGKRATMAIKDLVHDPDGYLKGVVESEQGDSFFSKMKKNVAKTLRGFTNVNASQNSAVFDQDINAAAIFDNRTRDSIVKVIPTLLAKIHAEIKSLRMRDIEPSQHELSFNYKTQEFQTKDIMISSIKDDMNNRIKNNIGYSLESIENMLVNIGKMNKTLAKEFKPNLIKYLYNPKSRINVDALSSKDFLELLDKKYHKDIKNAVFHLKKAFQEDPDLHDNFNSTMKSIKAGLPNTNNIAKELISSGKLDIAKDLGFVKHDIHSGSIVSNNEKMGDITADLYSKLDGTDMQPSVLSTITKNNENLLKSKVESVKSGFNTYKDKAKSWFGFGKKYYNEKNEKIDKYVKEYYQKANEYSKPYIDKMSQELSEQIDKLKETEAYKKADAKIQELMESDEAKKVIEKYRKANTIIDNIDKKHNISQKAKWLKDLTKSKITGLYNNNNGEREDLLNTIKDKVQYDQYGKPVVEGLQEGLQDMKKDAVDFLNDKQTASGLFSKYKGKVKNLFKRGKEVATSDKAKEMYSKAVDKGKATIEKGKEALDKGKMTFDRIKDPVERKELMQELKEDFLKAKQYSETKAENFKEYLEEIGFDLGSNPEETISKILTTEDKGSIFTRLKNKFNKFKQKTMEEQIDNLEEKLDNASDVIEIAGQDKEQTEALKKEFFESPEYKSGDVTDFEEWCRALGYKIKKNKAVKTAKGLYKAAKAGYKFVNSDFFKKTRALDRKIFMSIPKALGGVLKVGGKLGLKAGKFGGQALATSVGALTSIGMNTADSISAVLLSRVSSTLDRIADKDEPKKTKERANSWKDRIKLFSKDKAQSKTDKKKGFMGGVANFVKEHPTMTLGLGITAMVGLLKALNISMGDVKDFASGIWKGIKFIGSVISGIANTIAGIWNFIKNPIDNTVSGIKSLFGFGDKSKEEVKTDENGNAITSNGEEPSEDKDDGETTGAEILGMGAATLGGAYVGKKVYNVGKAVVKPIYNAGKFAVQGAVLGGKAMAGIKNKPKPDIPNSVKPDAPSSVKPDIPSNAKPDVPNNVKPNTPNLPDKPTTTVQKTENALSKLANDGGNNVSKDSLSKAKGGKWRELITNLTTNNRDKYALQIDSDLLNKKFHSAKTATPNLPAKYTPSKPTFLEKFHTLLSKCIDKISWALPNGTVETMKKKTGSAIEYIKKAIPSWDSMKKGFNRIVKVAKRKLSNKGGDITTKALTKLSLKLGVYFGLASTGVGAILTLGPLLWDLGWIIKYWLVDAMSFWCATAKQMIGIDLTEEDLEATDEDIKAVQKQSSGVTDLNYDGSRFHYMDRSNGAVVYLKKDEAIKLFGEDAVNGAIEKYKKWSADVHEMSREKIADFHSNSKSTNDNKTISSETKESSTRKDIKDALNKPANNLNYNNGRGTRRPEDFKSGLFYRGFGQYGYLTKDNTTRYVSENQARRRFSAEELNAALKEYQNKRYEYLEDGTAIPKESNSQSDNSRVTPPKPANNVSYNNGNGTLNPVNNVNYSGGSNTNKPATPIKQGSNIPKVNNVDNKATMSSPYSGLEQFKGKIPEVKLDSDFKKGIVKELHSQMEEEGITDPRERAAFLATIHTETGGLKRLDENLNYSASTLRRVWPGRFGNKSDAELAPITRNPVGLANVVYANRLGNSNAESGDGWNYRGKGLIQLTGKSNYADISRKTGIDYVSNPDSLVNDPAAAVKSAIKFWVSKPHLRKVAQEGNLEAVRKSVNGGLIGYDHFKNNYSAYISGNGPLDKLMKEVNNGEETSEPTDTTASGSSNTQPSTSIASYGSSKSPSMSAVPSDNTPKASYADLKITPDSKSNSGSVTTASSSPSYTPSKSYGESSSTSVASYSSSKSTTPKSSSVEIANNSPTISMSETNKILAKQLEVQVKQLEVQMNMDQTLTQLLNNSNNFDPSKLMPREEKTTPKPAIGIQRNIAV